MGYHSADSLIQHDMDARPLFDKYEIPAIKKKKLFQKLSSEDTYYSMNKLLHNKTFLNLDLFIKDNCNW